MEPKLEASTEHESALRHHGLVNLGRRPGARVSHPNEPSSKNKCSGRGSSRMDMRLSKDTSSSGHLEST